MSPPPSSSRIWAGISDAVPTRLWRGVLLASLVGVACLAVLPTPSVPMTTGWDKLNHLAAFFVLALSGRLGFASTRSLPALALGLVAYGGLIEIVQMFVPGRMSEWRDLLADCVGIAAGLLVAQATLLWRARTGARLAPE